jgi:hypothetical protein
MEKDSFNTQAAAFVPVYNSNTQDTYDQEVMRLKKNPVPVKTQQPQVPPVNGNSQSFNFPDGGWVCSTCQNYNFMGRVKCNRCQKIKTKSDFNGKPKHLLKRGS